MGGKVAGVESNRLTKRVESLFLPPAIPQGNAEIIVSLGMIRLEFDGTMKCREGRNKVANTTMSFAKV